MPCEQTEPEINRLPPHRVPGSGDDLLKRLPVCHLEIPEVRQHLIWDDLINLKLFEGVVHLLKRGSRRHVKQVDVEDLPVGGQLFQLLHHRLVLLAHTAGWPFLGLCRLCHPGRLDRPDHLARRARLGRPGADPFSRGGWVEAAASCTPAPLSRPSAPSARASPALLRPLFPSIQPNSFIMAGV